MSQPPKPTRGGAAGVLLLFCLAAGAAGAVFDFTQADVGRFWIGAEPGMRAAIGAVAAVFAVLCARLARAVLVAAVRKGGRDGNHA